MPDLSGKVDLDRECAAFARYLIGGAVTVYVSEKYRDAHARRADLDVRAARAFDRFLLTVARTHAWGTWLVDAYTSVLFKPALVRRKWILLVAILESTMPTAAVFDVPDPGGRGRLVMRLGWRALTFLVGLGVSSVLFLPCLLYTSPSPRDS